MACEKTMNRTTSAKDSPKFDWSSKLDLGKVKPTFPIRILQTQNGELYISVTKAGITAYRMRQTLWMKIIGPLEPEKPLKGQLEEVGPWMKVEQTREDMLKVKDKWNSLSEGAFVISVDLSDMLQNESGVLAAIKSRDRGAVENLCPNPFLI